jgi:hypothetical protein
MAEAPSSSELTLDPAAGRKLDRFETALRQRMPDVFQQIFVVGSAACQDFRPGKSDLGFVAVARRGLSSSVLGRLEELHKQLAAELPGSPLDGVYVTAADLARGPTAAPSGPHARLDRFCLDGSHKRRPLDWHATATGSIALWEDGADDLDIWTNGAELNRDLLRAAAELHAEMREFASLDRDAAASSVLGVARLHFTLLTGRFTSKTKAGLYGLITFPERWRPVLDAALASRSAAGSPALQSKDAVAFVQAVAADMLDLA